MRYCVFTVFTVIVLLANAQENNQDEPGWWMTPQRMLQTNLREIDATMDIDRYVQEVKDFGANVVLFNAGGIVANYPTGLEYHWQNTFMEGDFLGEVLPRLHAENIKMIGRFDFSKINEKYASRHPEWLYVSEKGEHVNYNGQVHTCLTGGYQQEYMFRILKEAVTRYPLDGVFFNMIGFPQRDYSRNFHGICQCENCRKSFKAYSGLDLPKHDGDPEVLEKYRQWQRIRIDKQFIRVQKLIKSTGEDIVICTYTEKGVDVIRKESGAAVGREIRNDTDKAQWTLLTTENKQLANTSVHFYQTTFRHSAAAPHLHTRRIWQQFVNGAWLDFYCIGPLQRLEDRAAIKPISRIYHFHRENEKWLLHTESAAEVGLLRHEGDDYRGWVQILSEHHIPFDLVSFQHSNLQNYRTIIVPESGRIDAGNSAALDHYVENGGRLLLSGRMPDHLTCLGRPALKKTWPLSHSMYVRIRPEDKEKLKVTGLKDFDLVHLRGDFYEYQANGESETMLRLIHDVMYGPPEKCYYHGVSDIPGLLLNRYGDGKAAIFPFRIGAMYREWGNRGHALLVSGTLDNLLETGRRLHVNTSALTEVTHRRDPDEKFEWVALYNHSGRMGNSFHPPVPVDNTEIMLKTDKEIKHIISLSNGHELPGESKSGRTIITLPQLNVYEIVLVEYL